MANTITVKFKAEGDKKLKSAIDALSKAQGRLESQSKAYDNTLKNVNKSQKKVGDGLVDIKNKGRLVRNSFATIRSQLLLVSFGMGLVSNSILRLVQLYSEQELAERRLTVALGGRSQALIDQASALQAQTRFGDEAIIGAQAMLAAFIKDEDQIKKATLATLDLASAKGMDLKSASDLVAKSIGSSTNSLTRYGIEATGAAGSTERLESIVANIQNRFGGFAKGELDTTRGLLDATSNAIGDAGEAFGEVLLPPVEMTAKSLKFIAESVNPDRIRSYAIAVGALGIAFNSAAVGTALFVTQINLSRKALLRTGFGALAITLGEIAYQMSRVKEVTSDFDYALVGLGLKTVDLTVEIDNNTNSISENAEELQNLIEIEKQAENQIQNNITSLQTRLRVLQAEEQIREHGASVTNVANKMIAESADGVTEKEYELILAIAEIMVKRQEQIDQQKLNQEIQKEIDDDEAKRAKKKKEDLEELINAQKKLRTSLENTAISYMRNASSYESASQAIAASMVKELQHRIQLAIADAMASVFMTVPYPLNFILAAGAGAAAGSMLNAVMPKFEEGGLVGGRRHSQGGTMIEAERGEFVMSRDAVESIGAGTLEAMNEGGGGAITVNVSGNVMTDDFVENELAEKIATAVRRGTDFGMS